MVSEHTGDQRRRAVLSTLAGIARALLLLALASVAAWGCRVAWGWIGPQGAWVRLYGGREFQTLRFVRPVARAEFFFDRNPAPRVPLENFSARLSGWLYVKQDAAYAFATLSDGGNRLFIDDIPVIDNWRELDWDRSGKNADGVRLRKGWHRLRVEYFNSQGRARVRVVWLGGDIPPRTTIGGLSLWKYRLSFGG
jgi:hypothetical protein